MKTRQEKNWERFLKGIGLNVKQRTFFDNLTRDNPIRIVSILTGLTNGLFYYDQYQSHLWTEETARELGITPEQCVLVLLYLVRRIKDQ